jgi:hypothetical protein
MNAYCPLSDAFEATPLITIADVLLNFVGSVTDVAVRVTVPPAGTEAGAV